jgi:hypothetical protein
MPHQTPNTMSTQIGSFLSMQRKLRIRHNLHRKPDTKEANTKRPNNIHCIIANARHGITHSERNRERQRDDTQYSSFR